MPFESQAQRRFMYAKHPELAAEFEAATPKGEKLPEKKHPEKTVKRAYDEGFTASLARFKLAGEEIRLQIPRREFHGFDAAFKDAGRGEKKAHGEQVTQPMEPQADGDAPVEQLAELLQKIDVSPSQSPDATKNPLERNVAWGAPTNMSGGDTGSRLSDLGQPTSVGAVF